MNWCARAGLRGASLLALVVFGFGSAATAGAQTLSDRTLGVQAGEEATGPELEAWQSMLASRPIKARKQAEAVLARRPGSYVAHFVLGSVHHYAEANFPRALYHFERAMVLFERQHGEQPSTDQPWRWHARLLRSLAECHGDLDHHLDKVRFLERYNTLYRPRLIAERAWPLMKMKRFREARLAAEEGLAEEDERQTEVSLNALCAIEFEAGRDGASYKACKDALDYARRNGGRPSAVDLTNFAEAARSLFKLDEAESVLLEASEAGVSAYGNPWMELAELYTREGRYPEALNALREVPRYRNRRPPHVRDADRNEARRALASFFLVIGRPTDALRITDTALVRPDRRAHTSRDPAQDRSIIALLDRRARRMQADLLLEQACGAPWYQRLWARVQAWWLRWQGWMSGRTAVSLVADEERLAGIFRIGTAKSGVLPPWLAGDLIQLIGGGVAEATLARAQRVDKRSGAAGYYDAFAAEAAFARGDHAGVVALAERALGALGPAERLLRARTLALAAEAERRLGEPQKAIRFHDRALQIDPGVFRRLDLALPVQVSRSEHPIAHEVADQLGRSPRLVEQTGGLAVRVQVDGAGGRVCLLRGSGATLGCGRATPKASESPEAFAGRIVAAFHNDVFAPRVDLSQADATSLDGSNRVSRNPLEDLAGDELPLEE